MPFPHTGLQCYLKFEQDAGALAEECQTYHVGCAEVWDCAAIRRLCKFLKHTYTILLLPLVDLRCPESTYFKWKNYIIIMKRQFLIRRLINLQNAKIQKMTEIYG
jgi:hypothetical protein